MNESDCIYIWLSLVLSFVPPASLSTVRCVNKTFSRVCSLSQACATKKTKLTALEKNGIQSYVLSFVMGHARQRAAKDLQILFRDADFPEELPDRAAILEKLKMHMCRLYNRAVLPAGTNVGAQDTTRTIEKLTQARLSRFHNTGGASQQYVTLDALLHPQATRNQATLGIHIQEGFSADEIAKRCLLHTQLTDIHSGHREEYILDAAVLPPVVASYFQPNGTCHVIKIQLDVRVCYQRLLSPATIAHIIEENTTGLMACSIVQEGEIHLYIHVNTLTTVCHTSSLDLWSRQFSLPDKNFCCGLVPVTVFDTGSSSIVRQLQPPVLSSVEIETLLGATQNVRSLDNAPLRTSHIASFQGGTRGRKRYFSGSRRKAKTVPDECSSEKAILVRFVQRLITWFGHVLHHLRCSAPDNEYVHTLLNESSRMGDEVSCSDLLDVWTTGNVPEPTAQPSMVAILCCMLTRLCAVLQAITAASGRSDMAVAVFNETIFFLFASAMVRPYLQFQILTKLLTISLGGIRGIQKVTVDGQLVTAYCAGGTDCFRTVLSNEIEGICKVRTCTSSVPELGDVLGLEAVCALFSNGKLAKMLGVSNHACKFLTDYIACKGVFRGINRSTIIGNNGTLNAITVEDPARHITISGMFGVKDSCTGTSASVLLGHPVPCGTSFCSVSYNLESGHDNQNDNGGLARDQCIHSQ